MSWRSAALIAGALSLGGCVVQPMYGNFAAGGPGMREKMQAIAIDPIPDRIGHYLGNDLVLAFNGTGSTPTPHYRLTVVLNENSQTPLIDTVSGRASAASVVINANYTLKDIATGTEITKGKAFVFKSYDRTSQRFSNIRAARDAEIHDAQQLADQLRLRIASALGDPGAQPTQ
jgi:LPS-assembly lipoprotein